jgi:hypothetical protein
MGVAVIALVSRIVLLPIRKDSLVGQAEMMQKSLNIEELRSWALQTAETTVMPSNASYVFVKGPLPDSMIAIPAPANRWVVCVTASPPSGSKVVSLISFGSYRTYGLKIGNTNYVIPTNAHCIRLAPGIYFNESAE